MRLMHSYDAEGRLRVIASLAVISVLLVWLFHTGLGAIGFEPQWWLSVPSFPSVFSFLYWAFDRWGWRRGLLKKIGIVRIPDLNGKWEAQIISSYKADGGAYTASIVIQQRWSRMVVSLETVHSQSRSISACLRTDDTPHPELSYLYINEPKATAVDTINPHRGTMVVELKEGVLEGDYYTGRGRGTFGTIKMTRTQ